MNSYYDPDGTRLPIKLDSTTNGEFTPIPLSKVNRLANKTAQSAASDNAKRVGLKRRDFLVSSCGVASTLLAINTANATAGRIGGFYELNKVAALDSEVADDSLQGSEFIFDIQGHYVNPDGAWVSKTPGFTETVKHIFPKTACRFSLEADRNSHLRCIGPDEFIKDVFLDSDTDMMVLSFVPSLREAEPLTIDEAAATRDIVAKLEGTHRLMLHGRVNPNQDGDLQGMDELAERWDIAAWKTYTQWGPDGNGFFLSDEIGLRFIEKAIKLGIKNICIHKGVPFGPHSYEHSLCNDVGVVAKLYPDVNFLIYHSGYVPGQKEGSYDPDRNDGIDSLIKTVIDNQVPANSNVYAELGTTWRGVMQDPDSAAHTLGKLLKYIGENNILWGTDSIWYGSPQDQIQAFRTFQISEGFREKYGYPVITDEIRAKIFGLNAIRPYNISMKEVRERARTDKVANLRTNYQNYVDPSFLTYGPKTRRQFLNLLKFNRETPA